MELTITTLVKFFAGIMALAAGILLAVYINGGAQHNLDLMLGVIRHIFG